jgi:predicted PurR-regulated permease PerM
VQGILPLRILVSTSASATLDPKRPHMTSPKSGEPSTDSSGPLAVDSVVRIGLLALLVYWSIKVVGPFLTIALWSAILAVALYPSFKSLAGKLGGRRHLAAALITLVSLIVVLGPITWFGIGLVSGVGFVVDRLNSGVFPIPTPAESVKDWPFVGDRLYEMWTLAATNIKGLLTQVAPTLKPIGGKLLGVAGTVGFSLIEFVVAIVIAGFLYVPGPQLVRSLAALLHRVSGDRSGLMLKLAGDTIRNVSRGVVGVALLQSFLAAVGLVVGGVPGAGFLSLIALVLAIIQIGPALVLIPVVIWSWTAMTTTSALLFTAYMIPVGLIDNVLRPVLMARGLPTPMPIILVGVMGGTIAYGISGLFLGPIVLSVAWALVVAWVQDEAAGGTASKGSADSAGPS